MGLRIGIEALFSNVVVSLITEFIIVVLGVVVGHFVLGRLDEWRYGGWKVVVRRGEEHILTRAISAQKAKEILAEPAELSVFLKGVVSPYERIRCDLIAEGQALGLLIQDREGKRFIIDLARNPSGAGGRREEDEVL